MNELVVMDRSAIELAADPAEYVVQACERAKAWLADALEHGGIDEIVELKSQAEAVRVYTMQKQLGKDTQLSAAEIVRRAERGIGLAIRRGQEEGRIATAHEARAYASRAKYQKDDNLLDRPSFPSDFVPQDDLTANGAGIYNLTDGISDEQFDEVLAQAKKDGNLSRAAVVRRIRAKKDAQEAKSAALSDPGSPGDIPASNDRSPDAASRRREIMAEMGGQGYSSTQIADRLGMTVTWVRRTARADGIEINADRVLNKFHTKIDSNRIVRETVNLFGDLEMSLKLIDFDQLDRSEIGNWTTSLTESIRVLNRLNRRLKEMIQ